MSDVPSPRRPVLKTYGPIHLLWLAVCKLATLLLFRPCKLVRLPIALRGRSNIAFGRGFVCGWMNRLDAFGGPGCIRFGEGVELNDFVHIAAIQKVEIGNHVLIASRVFISDHDHGINDESPLASAPTVRPKNRVEPSRPVRIGDRVWIGEGAAVLSGVTIGPGAVIGAGAVVTSDIESDCVAVGVPARVVRRWNADTATWCRVPR